MRVLTLAVLVTLAVVACGPGPEDRAETRQMIADAVEASDARSERLVVDAVARSEARMRAETERTVREAVEAAEARVLSEVERMAEEALAGYGWQPNEWGPWDYPAGGLGLEEIEALFGLFLAMQETAVLGGGCFWDGGYGCVQPSPDCWWEEVCENGVCIEDLICYE